MKVKVAWGVATVALLGVGGLVTSIVRALPAGSPVTPGLTIAPLSGISSTEITLGFTPPDNACPGDTATGNFRWNTFMVPSSVDVATMTYNNQGVITPEGQPVRRPLFSALGGSSLVNKNTAVTTGQIVGTSTVNFAVWAPGDITPGAYKLGYACTKVPALGQPAETERFWQVEIAVTQSATGGPAQIAWATGTPTTTTTVATTTTTTVAPTTTTTVAPTTTTTVPASTTTSTVPGPTSTTSTVPVVTTLPPPPPPPPAPTQQVTQTLGVTKSQGGLVLTQRCGVYGPLPAKSDDDLGSLSAQSESTPSNSVGSPGACAIEFGMARLIGRGPKEGLYFAATGRLSQLTVTDARAGNIPWTVTGVSSTFNNGGNGANDSFSGNFLGWQPFVTSVADSSSGRRVTPGAVVEPSATNGLGTPKVLASTDGGRGVGSVRLDARLKLYIPASVSDGRFTATLTFTVI